MRGLKSKKLKIVVGIVLLLAAVVGAGGWFLSQAQVAVFEPRGLIAEKQRALMLFALLLSVVIVVPVFVMTFLIAWKYREGNTKAVYKPDWDHHRGFETAWWLIPLTLIMILSVVAWQSSHQLDPTRPLAASKKPLTIQVVALQWKWLFIYPEQDIATVNFVQLPVETPVRFEITADAPMNSFWIPQLGGQIYAMSGMSTHLNLMATQMGDYRGSSANISGEGFAGMNFTARASSDDDFAAWVGLAKQASRTLNEQTYSTLSEPSLHDPQVLYNAVHQNLYNEIVMKYTDPAHRETQSVQHNQAHRDYEVQP